MKEHIKKYIDFFGYDENDFIPSELSAMPANDVHHIERRGMGGGGKTKGGEDVNGMENLMALTREEHVKYGDKKEFREMLKNKHLKFIKLHGKQ